MTVDLAAGPGRRARTAVLALRYCRVEIARPVSHKRPAADLATLPRSVTLTLVEAREIGAPATGPAVHWRLLTTHAVTDVADRSEEHTSEPQSIMRIPYAVFCFKKKHT